MSRVDRILKYRSADGLVESFGIVAAYCYCLGVEESCELLRRSIVERPEYRIFALRKVCADIETDFLNCHLSLVNHLLRDFEKADHRLRQSLGFVLSRIAEVAPTTMRRRIQKFFLSSQYVGVRRRGYKSVDLDERMPSRAVEDAWMRYNDYEAAWLITKRFPVLFLIEHRELLQEHFDQGWQLSRLYLRIAEVDPTVLVKLKSLDPISYCYVLNRLGLELEDQEARSCLEYAKEDERFGLFVWCLGKLGHWELLHEIEARLPEIQDFLFKKQTNGHPPNRPV